VKEVCAIIRRDKLPATKEALAGAGFPSLTIQSVEGRGKQRGDIYGGCDPDDYCQMESSVKLRPTPSEYALEHSLPKAALFVPKRMLTMVVTDDAVKPVVEAILAANTTGQFGDGRIFISPVEAATRIRTGEDDVEAII
jgi:nitrogen regulatory protein PII 2